MWRGIPHTIVYLTYITKWGTVNMPLCPWILPLPLHSSLPLCQRWYMHGQHQHLCVPSRIHWILLWTTNVYVVAKRVLQCVGQVIFKCCAYVNILLHYCAVFILALSVKCVTITSYTNASCNIDRCCQQSAKMCFYLSSQPHTTITCRPCSMPEQCLLLPGGVHMPSWVQWGRVWDT